uniref:Uncharacterized protein n=1 Tax=Ascaris lumbricoides TaxID=6252 RepID=A0A0M3HY91_ASCLU
MVTDSRRASPYGAAHSPGWMAFEITLIDDGNLTRSESSLCTSTPLSSLRWWINRTRPTVAATISSRSRHTFRSRAGYGRVSKNNFNISLAHLVLDVQYASASSVGLLRCSRLFWHQNSGRREFSEKPPSPIARPPKSGATWELVSKAGGFEVGTPEALESVPRRAVIGIPRLRP